MATKTKKASIKKTATKIVKKARTAAKTAIRKVAAKKPVAKKTKRASKK